MARIAVYGGAFNPPHLAHAFTITYLCSLPDIDRVSLLPTYEHAFGKEMAPFKARVAMLEAAIRPFDARRVGINTFERDRGGLSRTYDTLDALSLAYPDDELIWVMGADNLSEAHRWYRFDDLVARWKLIVLGRPGSEEAYRRFQSAAWFRGGPTLPCVSSSVVRDALRAGDPDTLTWLQPEVLESARALYGRSASPPTEPVEPAGSGPVWVLGAGRAGRSLAAALRAAKVPVAGVWNRTPTDWASHHGALPAELIDAPVWLLTVCDGAIEPMAARLAEHAGAAPGRVVLHCAARLGAEVLETLTRRGVATGSMHPLQSLGDPAQASAHLRDAWFTVEGAAAARAVASDLVNALGGRRVILPGSGKPAYHAAAVLAGNFTITLAEAGIGLLAALGIDRVQARQMLLPLMRGSLARLEDMTPCEALTGPLARHDIDAIEAHVRAISVHGPAYLEAYRALARITARWMGWNVESVERLEAALLAGPPGRVRIESEQASPQF